MQSKKHLWSMGFSAAVLVLCICALALQGIPHSSSWLHETDMLSSQYTVGRIKFLFDSADEEIAIPVELYVDAPTRFFDYPEAEDEINRYRDSRFDDTVGVRLITGVNVGDVDMLVNLTYEQIADTTAASIYYIFVPVAEFEALDADDVTQKKKMHEYLSDKGLHGRAEMDAINTANLHTVSAAIRKPPDDGTQPVDAPTKLCYLVYWAEYDPLWTIPPDKEFAAYTTTVQVIATAVQTRL